MSTGTDIVAKIEERERIIDSQTEENKIKMIMVDMDINDLLNINNEIYNFDIWESKTRIGVSHIGMDYEILFMTENAFIEVREIIDKVNRLPFVQAHYDAEQIETAIEDEEQWVGVTIYTYIDARYQFKEYDIEYFDIDYYKRRYNEQIFKRL